MREPKANAAPALVTDVRPAEAGSELIESADGSVAFCLSRVRSGLFVQRTHRHAHGVIAIQCLLIDGPEEFSEWCDVEPSRFENPMIFDRLRRFGDDAFTPGR